MSRFRGYGNARGTRTYISRREEYFLTEAEKHEAYLRRKAADEAAKKLGSGAPLMPYRPQDITAAQQANATVDPQLSVSNPRPLNVAPEEPMPLTGDLFAYLEDEEEELEEAPRP